MSSVCFHASVVDVIYEGIARAAGVVRIYGGAASTGGSPTGRAVTVTAVNDLENYEAGQSPSYPIAWPSGRNKQDIDSRLA